jgi:hypothetical protein
MATLGELVEIIARYEGLDPATVRLIARHVREAGLITTGGRGPSAAQMNFADAANLLIAVNASVVAREAPEIVREYRRLKAWTSDRTLGEFGDALEKLIDALSTTHTLPKVYLSVPMPALLSQQHIRKVQLTFQRPEARANLEISVYNSWEMQMRFPTSPSRLSEMTARKANKVTCINFDFSVPQDEQQKVILYDDGTTTWEDGSPWINQPMDRKDTTVIGYPTISAVARLLEYGNLARAFDRDVGSRRHGILRHRRRQD